MRGKSQLFDLSMTAKQDNAQVQHSLVASLGLAWPGNILSCPVARPWECVLWEVQWALLLGDRLFVLLHGSACLQGFPAGAQQRALRACGGWALWGLFSGVPPTAAYSGKGCGMQPASREVTRAEADGQGGQRVPPANPPQPWLAVQPTIGRWEKGLLFTETKRRLKSF